MAKNMIERIVSIASTPQIMPESIYYTVPFGLRRIIKETTLGPHLHPDL